MPKTNHNRGFSAKKVKSGPNGTAALKSVSKYGLNFYNSAHHGFERAKAATKKASHRLTRRTLKIESE